MSFGAFLRNTIMTHRKNSKTRCKTSVERLLGRRVRLPAIADFDSCEPFLFNKKTKTFPAFIAQKRLNTSFIQPENSTRLILVSDKEIIRLDEDNVKTKPPVERTISQSESQHQNRDVVPSHQHMPIPTNLPNKRGRL